MLRIRGLAIGLTACAFALGACGSNSSSSGNGELAKPPDQILSDAVNAARQAPSVRVTASSTSVKSSLDLKLVKGGGGTGSMVVRGVPVALVDVGNTIYMKAPAPYWASLGAGKLASRLGGRWLKGSANGSFAAMASLTSIDKLFGGMVSGHGTIKKGATTTINGHRAVGLIGGIKGGTLYVATTGKPYPLKVVPGDGSGDVYFTNYGEPVALAAPPNAVDISSVQRGLR